MTFSIEPGTPGDLHDAVAIDDDACRLFESVGMTVTGSAFEAYSEAEKARWSHAAEREQLFFARDAEGARVGLVVLAHVDDGAYLEQLSVRQCAMRRGLGRMLLGYALDWTREHHARVLWLTTYGHLGWNAPFYESAGFSRVNESDCGGGIRAILAEQRAVLPLPERRVAMRRYLDPS